ncbi:hypothetical protein SUGI_0896940 [Cryptomeria japonica]|nr:hypothetical protein SUGI_0896940 [Cryptomeria japonica]
MGVNLVYEGGRLPPDILFLKVKKHWIHYSWLGSRSPAPGVIASRWAGGIFDAAVTAFGWSPGRRRHKDIRGWACIKAGRNKWLIFLDRSRPLSDDQIKMRGENECFRDQ